MATTDLDEYVFLLSDKEQKKGQFTTQLGKTFNFGPEDQIFVGLKELSISCQFSSEHVAPKSSALQDKLQIGIACKYYMNIDETFRYLYIDEGYYTAQTLVTSINERIAGVLGPDFPKKDCYLWFNAITKRIEFFVNGTAKHQEKRVSLLIFGSVSKLLGLQKKDDPVYRNFLIGAPVPQMPTPLHNLHAVAPYPSSVKNFDLILVYISILKRSVVGHDLLQLSEIFGKEECTPGHSTLTFRNPNPKYIRIAEHLRSIHQITVELASESGDILLFDKNATETRVTLHFVSKSMLK